MIDKFVVIEADTPVGQMLLTDVSRRYTQKIAGHYEAMTYEAPVTKEVQTLSYNCFIDVGAAFGYFSMIAAARPQVSQVFAFEPHPIRYGLLWWNARGNEKINAGIEFVTSGGTAPQVSISRNPSGLFGPEHPKRYTLSPGVHQNMHRVVLDHVYSQAGDPVPTLIKIDVEGFELDVLDGGQRLFHPRNHFIIETHKATVEPQRVIDYMAERGFSKCKTLIDNTKNGSYLFQHAV